MSIALGQPLLLHLRDSDLKPLSEADFEEDEAAEAGQEGSPAAHSKTLTLPKQTPCHINFTLKHVGLAIRGILLHFGS